MKRSEQKKENCWAIEDLYGSLEEFEKDFAYVEQMIPVLGQFEGRMSSSSEVLLEYLEKEMQVSAVAEKVYVYAAQRSHEDMENSTFQDCSSRASSLMVKLDGATSFFRPEILEISKDKMMAFYEECLPLRKYQIFLDEILRRGEHTLDAKMEGLLADVAEIGEAPKDIFAMFNNADVQFQAPYDSKGKEWTLTHGTYISLMESEDRELRKNAFTNLYGQYKNYDNTLAAIFRANVKQHVFYGKARNYADSLSYGLDQANIPTKVYTQLIQTVHEHLPLMYRYVSLRKKMLKVSELHMYDLYAPMVSNVDKKISFDEAKQIVLEGLEPMGQQYVELLKKGFEERWIDVYENEGKRSGAYSWGAYGTHPFVLMNYQDNLKNVFTLAHEMGHALHSYYSDANQDYVYAGYKIFVAEVASTCNESLLIHHLLANSKDKKERLYLMNYFMEQFRGTLFRQTMFAEFELKMHQMVDEGKVLTTEVICDTYYDLNKKYFGAEVVVDAEIAMEWARIPHFYTPFYVYQYATGFSAAICISRQILAGNQEVREGYQKFLQSGSSMDPISLLKLAGVDMTSADPICEAMGVMEQLLDEWEKGEGFEE